jgi:CRISPR-associated endoribonuclease Cas6
MTITISAHLPQGIPNGIGYKDLHRLACFLIEDSGVEAHEQQAKPFAIWPLIVDDADEGIVEITIQSLVDDPLIVERVSARLNGHEGRRANLGKDTPLHDAMLNISEVLWDELAAMPPASSVEVELLSPMTYSRSGISYPLPDPILVHRQLTTRWNQYAPDDFMQIPDDLSREINGAISLTQVSISSVRLQEFNNKIAGVGTFSFQVDKKSDVLIREWFASLWSYAQFCGLGAMTTQGLGAVSTKLQ